MFKVRLIDGPLQGIIEVPELKQSWHFKIRYKNKWCYYYRVGDYSENKPRGKKKLKEFFHAEYKYCSHFGLVTESHCDVQTFLRWYRRTYHADPESIIPAGKSRPAA